MPVNETTARIGMTAEEMSLRTRFGKIRDLVQKLSDTGDAATRAKIRKGFSRTERMLTRLMVNEGPFSVWRELMDSAKVGHFYRTTDGDLLFFRTADHQLYDLDERTFAFYLIQLSGDTKWVRLEAVDKFRACTRFGAPVVPTHFLAYNSAGLEVIAVNTFDGHLLRRVQGDHWRRQPRVTPVLGGKKLDEITTADVEHFLASLQEGERAVSPASVNRYRDLLSGLFKRALRLGLVVSNPVRGIPKLREAGRRLVYLPSEGPEEKAIRDTLPPKLRSPFTLSLHTGLRWGEQRALRWQDVDVLSGLITVGRSKNGASRQVPMNAVVRSTLFDLSTQRKRPNDPDEPIFDGSYRTVARLFSHAVRQAQAGLRAAGKDASRLEGYTWHSNRHSFASRLVMAGVDLRTVQELGGWKTLSMVLRYSHLAPSHLQAAVERLVPMNGVELARN